MPERLKVLVLCGGRSAEHEISLLSARFVLSSLDPDRFEAVVVGIDPAGKWRLQDPRAMLAGSSDPREQALAAGDDVSLAPPTDGRVSLQSPSGTRPIDVVFPVLHGPYGEDGTVQGLLELAQVPYVGAGVLGSAVGMDKDVMKRLLLQAGLPVLPYRTVRARAFEQDGERALDPVRELELPVFVKPANLGSSVGVTRVTSFDDLASAVSHAFEYDEKVVVEQGLDRPRELECAVLGGADPVVSLPGEIVVDHPDGFYSYAAKYVDGHGVTTRIPAELEEQEMDAVRILALRTFEALECEGLARVDLFFSAGREIFVNEINTLPGFTEVSMYPKLMQHAGLDGREVVTRLIADALERAARRARKRSQP